jgi:VanZ family protein
MKSLIYNLRPFASYLLFAWLLAIIIVSSVPSIPTLKIHTGKTEIRLDYLIHFCEYGVLAFMAFLSFAGNKFKMSCRKFIIITLCLISFAILDEFHQKLIPGRSFNLKDILSNILGIFALLIFCALVFRKIAGKITKIEFKNP